MKDNMNLIVMLTYNDKTVKNACEIFEACKNSKAQCWGFKEEGLEPDKMKKLFAYMKECGKTVFLEVVAYTEKECLAGAKMAAEYGCDVLMGTMYFDSINEFCKEYGLKYMPFVGTVEERPSVLKGNVDEIINEAKLCIEKGVDGFDLLGYRFVEDAFELNKRFVNEVNAPVCIAGSVNSYERLDELKSIKPWAFTIGSAFFDNAYGNDFARQIDNVCEYIDK